MLSVSELNEQAKTLLETTFSYVEVGGEISRLVKHGSGHWYFTLKDEKAAISAVIYKFNAAKLKFDVADGMKVALFRSTRQAAAISLSRLSYAQAAKASSSLHLNNLKRGLRAKGFLISRAKNRYLNFPARSRSSRQKPPPHCKTCCVSLRSAGRRRKS